jgi:hypothetical protein
MPTIQKCDPTSIRDAPAETLMGIFYAGPQRALTLNRELFNFTQRNVIAGFNLISKLQQVPAMTGKAGEVCAQSSRVIETDEPRKARRKPRRARRLPNSRHDQRSASHL